MSELRELYQATVLDHYKRRATSASLKVQRKRPSAIIRCAVIG